MSYENTGILRLMNKANFNKDTYIREVIKNGDSEINNHVKLLSDSIDTKAMELKNLIYDDCELFIDAAKTISRLEQNMHFVNHNLQEQSRIMSDLHELQLVSDSKDGGSDIKNIHNSEDLYNDLLESIEGASNLIRPNRKVIYALQLHELDNNAQSSSSRPVLIVVLSDLLLLARRDMDSSNLPINSNIGSATTNSITNHFSYSLTSSYDLTNVSLTNITDTPLTSSANSFKLIVFPETKIFKTQSSRDKVMLMQVIEKQTKLNQKRRPISVYNQLDINDNSRRSSDALSQYLDGDNVDVEDRISHGTSATVGSSDAKTLEWLEELPDNLDICIAERDLVGAVKLVEQARQVSLGQQNHQVSLTDQHRNKLALRVAQLTEVLADQLTASSARRRQDPQHLSSVRTAVSLLQRLQRAALATELLLAQRTTLFARRLAEFNKEGSHVIYVTRLSLEWHRMLLETLAELEHLVNQQGQFSSRIFSWCQEEAGKFADQLRILLIESRAVPFLSLCRIVWYIRTHSYTVEHHATCGGIPLNCVIEQRLSDSLLRCASEHAQVLLDAIKLRASDELWSPIQLGGAKDRQNLVNEMQEANLDIETYIDKSDVVHLTENTLQFSRSIVLYAEALVQLGVHAQFAQTTLGDLFQCHAQVFARTSSKNVDGGHTNTGSSGTCNDYQSNEFIMDNLLFLTSTIIPRVQQLFPQSTGIDSAGLNLAVIQYQQLLNQSRFVKL